MAEGVDHKAVLKTLSAEERARLTERSDRAGLLHLAAHFGAIAGLAALILAKIPGWPILMLPLGVLLVFLFTLLHETAHFTPFKTPWLNTAVGHVCGFLLFLPAKWFRYFHLAHHRHTQDPEHDPELASPKPETWRDYFIHVSGLPVWRSQAATLLRNALGRGEDAFVPPSQHASIQRESGIYIALYTLVGAAALWSGASEPLFVWIFPIILGQPFLRLYLLAEHGRCAYVANMLENSRTTMTTALVRRIAWNMPYHAEHHAYPAAPFHKLPALHKIFDRHLKVKTDGYVRFHREYVAGFDGARQE